MHTHLRTFTGILQADIYAGYNRLYAAGRSPGPVTEAACWSHCRRKPPPPNSAPNTPRPSADAYDRCIEDAKKRPHPTIEGKTVWQVFQEEQPFLMAYRGPFDGFHATEVAVSKTCLVRFDRIERH